MTELKLNFNVQVFIQTNKQQLIWPLFIYYNKEKIIFIYFFKKKAEKQSAKMEKTKTGRNLNLNYIK